MADGSIRVNTALDNTEAKKDLKELDKMCERTAKHIEDLSAEITVKSDTSQAESSIEQFTVNSSKSVAKAQEKLKELEKQIQDIKNSYAEDFGKVASGKYGDEQRNMLLEMEQIAVEKLQKEYDSLTEQIKNYNLTLASDELKSENMSTAFVAGITSAEQYNQALADTKMRMSDIEASAQRIASERDIDVSSLLEANSEYQKLNGRLKELIKHQGEFGKAAKNSFSKSSKLADNFGNSVKKGIKIMARYTLAMFGARSAFFAVKQAMSTYISSNEELSNSVTAMKGAFAEVLGPAIERVINLLKIAMSYVFAFIKALTGVDFVARYNAKALNKQAESTKALTKAQKANQRQSAGFDEQNKLSDTSSSSSGSAGSSGGAATLDLPTVSEEALGKIQTFADKLKEVWKWVNENKTALLILGGVILGAIAAFELMSGITSTVAALEKMGKVINNTSGIAATSVMGFMALAAGIVLIVVAVKDMLENGPNWKNILTLLAGAVLVLVSAILMFNASLLASPVTWIIIGIMALIAAIALCVVYWDDIKAAVVNFCNKVKEKFTDAWGNVKKKWSEAKEFFAGVKKKITDTFANIKTWFKEKFTEAWKSVQCVFSGAGKFFGGIWDTIKSKFTSIGSSIGNAIGEAFKKVVNSILNFAENTINKFIKGINGAIDLINKIPGVSIPTLNLLTIPKLAKGGIVNNVGKGVPLIAGEAGAEAILPLENNTGWMDILAEKINGGNSGSVTIPVYLDGKLIAKYIIDLQKRKAFATNRG